MTRMERITELQEILLALKEKPQSLIDELNELIITENNARFGVVANEI